MRRRLVAVAAATSLIVVIALLSPLAQALRTINRDSAIRDAQLVARTAIPARDDRASIEVQIQRLATLYVGDITVSLGDGETPIGTPIANDTGIRAARRSGRSSASNVTGGVEVLEVIPNPVGGPAPVVRVFVPTSSIRRRIVPTYWLMATLGVVLVLIAIAAFDRLARSIVRSVRDLAAVTRRLEQGELDARVEVSGPPEIREVGTGLNRLADRIGELLVAEREAVADLSHRLRTPITSLRLDAETLAESHPSEDAVRVVAGIDHLTAAVDDLIRQARRPTRDLAESSDVVAVCRSRLAFWGALAEDQGRVFSLRCPDFPLQVAVGEEDLAACFDVLLGNVFDHTAEGVGCRVTVEAAGKVVRLTIDDDGPGIVSGSVDRGESTAGSTGLGLDIARRTAEMTGGRLRVGSRPEGGARISMELGRWSAEPAVRPGDDQPERRSVRR